MLRRNSRSSLLSAIWNSRLDATLVDPYTSASFLPANAGGWTHGNASGSDAWGQHGEPEGSEEVQEETGGRQKSLAGQRPQDADRGSDVRYRRSSRRDRSRLVGVHAEHGVPPARPGEVPAQEDRRRAGAHRERH